MLHPESRDSDRVYTRFAEDTWNRHRSNPKGGKITIIRMLHYKSLRQKRRYNIAEKYSEFTFSPFILWSYKIVKNKFILLFLSFSRAAYKAAIFNY